MPLPPYIQAKDGLGCEFYIEFESLLIQPMLNLFQDLLRNGFLPRSLAEANISRILKKGKTDDFAVLQAHKSIEYRS